MNEEQDNNKNESSSRPAWKSFQRVRFNKKNVQKRLRRAESMSQRHAHRFIIKRVNSLRKSRRQIIIWSVVVGLILGAIAVQAYLFSTRTNIVASTNGGTYVEGTLGELDTLNPLYASSSSEVAASRLLFSSLFSYDQSGHLRTDVAKSISIDDKGLNYIVTLRDNVYWHDGQKMTADDVVFTINTIKNSQTRVRSSLRSNWVDISAKTLKVNQVVFTLPVGYASFVHALTFPIVPKHVLSEIAPGALQESAFSRTPIGSGPFVYRLLQNTDIARKHKSVHMTAFEKYYRGKPKLNRFELNAYASEESLLKAARAHEVTAVADISVNSGMQLKSSGYTIRNYPVDNGVYAIFNTTSEILRDVKVRRAIQIGIDTKRIRQAAGGNLPELHLPFLNSQIQSTDLPKAPVYNSSEAKKALAGAGWNLDKGTLKKGSTPLRLRLATTKSDQFSRTVEEIAKQLKNLGIAVEVSVIDTANPSVNFVTDTLQPRDFDILVYELPIGADPDVYAYWHSSQLGFSGYNFANYSSPVSDAILASARDRLDQQLRDVKYSSFAKQWLSDAPAIGLYQQVATYASSDSTRSLGDTATFITNSDRYADVQFWTSEQTSVYKTP